MEKKGTMIDVREIAIRSTALPMYKAMGFKADSKIARLAAEAIALIEYKIGDDLKKISAELIDKVNEIKKDTFDEIEEGFDALDEDQRKVVIDKVNRLIDENQEVQELYKKESKIWKTEINMEFDSFEIEDKEYSEKIGDEHKTVQILGKEYTVDGYAALLTLVSMELIIIK